MLSRLMCATLALALCTTAVAKEKYVSVRKANHRAVDETGRAALAMDLHARDAFAATHPGVLPELRLKVPEPKAPPVAFDWCALGKVCPLKKQLTGDCWNVAATKALECSELRVNGINVDLSPQAVLDVARSLKRNPSGGAPFAYQHFVDRGAPLTRDYPYTAARQRFDSRIPSPFRAVAFGFVGPKNRPASVAKLKRALLEYGPIEVGIYSCHSFHQLRDDHVLETPGRGEKLGGHSVLLVGWDDRRGKHGAWKIQNNRRAVWGDQGYGWIGYGYKKFAYYSMWVRAQSRFYPVPDQIRRLEPHARPFPGPADIPVQ